jgi:hypothetical protein
MTPKSRRNELVSELSRLERSMLECMEILALATGKKLHLYAVKGNWQLENSLQSKIMAIERDYLYDVPDPSFLRVIHYTQLIWRSDKTYASLDEAFAEMEDALIKWCAEQGVTPGQGQ